MTQKPKLKLAQDPEEIRAAIASVEAAVEDIREGKIVILVDDADRENEGDLVHARPRRSTPEAINFMATHGRGLICLPLTERAARASSTSRMMRRTGATRRASAPRSRSRSRRAHGVTTGISRARPRRDDPRRAIADDARPATSRGPGHVFPLRARDGRRAACARARPKASVDLARLAGLQARRRDLRDHERRRDDGAHARPRCSSPRRHELKIVTHRRPDRVPAAQREAGRAARRIADMPTRAAGDFRCIVYEQRPSTTSHHMALVKGEIGPEDAVLGARPLASA